MKLVHMVYISLGIVLLALFVGFIPIKQAIKKESLDKTDNYIIVNVQKATVSSWIAIGDSKGDYDIPKSVRLTGNAPSGYGYEVEAGQNTFVCYGNFDRDEDFHGEKYFVFTVERWDILYPVKRNSYFDWILPSSYLCVLDRWGRQTV